MADSKKHPGLATPVWVAICAVCLVAGLLAGHFLINGGQGAATINLGGKTTLSSNELDTTIASYTRDGKTVNVTARDVITKSSTLDDAANSDGTYNVPSASNVVSYAMDKVLLDEAEARGISVSDEELATYTENTFGTSDFSTISSQYKMDEDLAKEVIKTSAVINKLRSSVTTTELPEQPTKPTEPAEGEEDTASADYAAYIINLVGDEWDSEAGTWAKTDGTYYSTLSGYEITNDSATYAAANAAYTVASNKYTEAATQFAQEWSSFYQEILGSTSMQLGSLLASTSTSN